MYKIAICDDNTLVVDYISDLITNNLEKPHKVFKYDNPLALEIFINDIIKGALDILIIDINLGVENGIKVAERIKKQHAHIRIIFMSGQVYYAGEIFETKPIYFLIKPIAKTKLMSAIQLAIQDIDFTLRDTISIQSKGLIIKLDLRKVMYIESHNRTAIIYEEEKGYEIYVKLEVLEKILPEKFCRCHQSFMLNMDYAKQLNMYQFILYSGKTIPVSQLKYNRVRQSFMKYLGDNL